MAYISFQPSDFFSPTIYTGNGVAYGSGGNAITGVGFQPDLTWIKCRTAGEEPVITDSVRGVTKILRPNGTYAESTATEGLNVFGSDGFTLGNSSQFNEDTENFVSWNWKAGTTSGLTGGTITPSAYSINTTSGFSAIAYTGTTTGGETIPHGLGVAPDMVIVKKLSTTSDWKVYNSGVDATAPEDYTLTLNTTAMRDDSVGPWHDTAPTSTLVTLGVDNNSGSVTFIAYCFASIKGYSKIGKYVGNGDFDGPFTYTGFRPAFVMIKSFVGSGENWAIIDDKRSTYNVTALSLNANDADAEVTSYPICDFTSNGFKIRSNRDEYNGSTSRHYAYAAFAEFPFVSSNSKAGTAR